MRQNRRPPAHDPLPIRQNLRPPLLPLFRRAGLATVFEHQRRPITPQLGCPLRRRLRRIRPLGAETESEEEAGKCEGIHGQGFGRAPQGVLVFSEQSFFHRAEFGQRGFEGFDDLGREDRGSREVVAVFEGLVFEPEDVEVSFVSCDDLVVGEAFEAVGLPPLGEGSSLVHGFEVFEVFIGQRIRLEREVLVGAQVVDPEVLSPGLFVGGFALKEEHVGLHALGVEDAGGQAQQGVDVAALEEFAADGFTGSAFEEHVVGEDDSGGAADREFADDVLEEVELLVRGGGPEVVALVFLLLGADLAVFANDGVAAFLAEGRVGQNHVKLPAAGLGQGVGAVHRRIVGVGGGADAVQVKVHGAEADHAGDDVGAAQRRRLEVLHLRFAELVVLGDVVVRSQQEAAGAAGGIADHLSRLRLHHIDHRTDERARGEVLSCALVRGAGGLFEQAFINRALDVHVHAGPILIGDHLDHALEIGGVGDLVLGLAEDDADEAGLLAEAFERVAVMDFEVVAALAAQHGPGKGVGDGVVEAQLGHLVGQLEEEQIRDLLDVVAVTDARVLEDVGVVPDFGDDGC